MPMPQDRLIPGVDRATQDATFGAERAKLDVSLWDRTSDVNGAPAAHFLERPDVAANEHVFLISEAGTTVIFQPVPEGDPMEAANAEADTLAANRVTAQLLTP